MITPVRNKPRSLAGATILQLVPALRDDPSGRAAVDIALALLQSGARAIVAGEGGPLVGELRAFGGEWLPMSTDTFNPWRIFRNADLLAKIVTAERIDIVHAQSAGAAWSALSAIHRMPVFLVTSFPDRLPSNTWPGPQLRRSLARGDRVIAPSTYVSHAMIERYRIPSERISVIPRSIDTAVFDPVLVRPERIAALRRTWGVLPNVRVVFAPGRIGPWNGQLTLVEAARLMLAGGADRNIAFVLAGDDRADKSYTRTLRERARVHDVDTLFRFVGAAADMPTAIAAADVMAVTALEPPLSGRPVIQAQALGRPVIATTVGVLPESMLAPPRMREELRTGWLVRPGDASQLARALSAALALDITAYEALGARARQFVEFAFSPQSVAEAIRGVYTSLLARDS
jgi:glycosyltransferase involved in cell wall biosynthesis